MTRNEKALEVLKAGGYFRKQLETGYHGREQFHYRLRNADGSIVKGVGVKTFFEFEKAGMLSYRPCVSSSVWPQEWSLREKATTGDDFTEHGFGSSSDEYAPADTFR